jgi:phage/plasmid-associated DNA primase
MLDPTLLELLHDTTNEVEGSQSYTHVTHYPAPRYWVLKPSEHNRFWLNYCDLVERQPHLSLCLSEHITGEAPLVVDALFRFHADAGLDEDWEPYGDDFLYSLVQCYQEAMIETLNISGDALELICCVLETLSMWEERRSGPYGEETFTVSKLRLFFPYCRCSIITQGGLLRQRALHRFRRSNVLSLLSAQPVGEWEDIITSGSSTGSVDITMYGSETSPQVPKLHLCSILRRVTQAAIDGSEGISHIDIPLPDAFNPINHQHVARKLVNESIFTSGKEASHWVPFFLSVWYWQEVVLPRQAEAPPPAATSVPILDIRIGWREESDMALAEAFIPMLSRSRYNSHGQWLDIGRACYSASNGTEAGLNLWRKATEKACAGAPVPQFLLSLENIEAACRAAYCTFSRSYVTVKTLAWYAQKDQPSLYTDWHKRWCMGPMETALSCLHTDVTLALYRCYWLEFACIATTPTNTRWYRYRNHRWCEMNQGSDLRSTISHGFVRKFEALRTALARHIQESRDEQFRAQGELNMKKLGVLIGKLKTVSYKNDIMREAREFFSNDRLSQIMDSNCDTLGTETGVIEIVGRDITFREGKPEDFISKSTGSVYHSDYHWRHPVVMECKKWLGQIFVDQDGALLDHFMKFAASCLRGKNADKLFPMLSGGGDNSKSMLIKLFEAMYGPYCIKFPITVITGKRTASSSATPEMARAQGTRVAFMQEPEDEEPIRKGIVKEMTGGDSYFARLLHENGYDVQSTFKLILVCNTPPAIPNADRAMKERTKVFPCIGTWVDEAPESEAEQYRLHLFKKDPRFENKIPILAQGFFWMCVQTYPRYYDEGLRDPDIIKEVTDNYWKDNDIYSQFASECIQDVFVDVGGRRERDLTAKVTLSEVYREFKDWYRDAFPGSKPVERKVVKSELSQRWGRMANNAWHGIRIAVNAATTGRAE